VFRTHDAGRLKRVWDS